MSLGVAERISYQSREVEGTQSPNQTLDRGCGSCRILRSFLLKRLAVSALERGSSPAISTIRTRDWTGSTGAGSTHAWAEVYLPGAGLMTVDPTNRSVGGCNLIPVAVARDILQAMPVSGSFVGLTDSFLGMGVEVSVMS